ncbi:DUF2726 domain-containing protein [Jannaschia sp. 2305UL9-9]|uniref:DUF2726 domain-containing protein n=1 Tax=Jannaschia sp. 2305UL9-9 TaxID=3121638 RepID=UPI003528A11A
MPELSLAASPLDVLRTLIPLPRKGRLADAAFTEAQRAEVREWVFVRLSRLAHSNALHIAPSVALGSVFSVRDGRRSRHSTGARSALSHERVDILLLDRAAHPVLALDHATEDMPDRATRQRVATKIKLFERAGLPLMMLHGVCGWDDDRDAIESRLAAIATDMAHQGPSRRN